MILSYACKETEKIRHGLDSTRFPPEIQQRARAKLIVLDTVETLEALRLIPGNHLEKLKGDRVGQYSIRINNQWRICFIWRDANAYDVEITDYH